MALFLKILAGELKDTRTPARAGLTIGRKQGLLTIKDSKLSGSHAELEERPDGVWIVAKNSANPIKLDSRRVQELKLAPGVQFVLGRTPFEVVSSEDKPVDQGDDSPTAAITVTRTFWDNIRELAERAAESAKTSRREVQPFRQAVRLKFIRGLQAGTVWTIGYGPRMVGTSSLDLTLEDMTLPGVCFRLEPQGRSVLFKNETERVVRLNGKWVGSETLKTGDIIEIVNTQIQVQIE